MIVRTPPPKKARVDSMAIKSPSSDRHLVIYEDPPAPESSDDPSDHMLCTYQCRQMVKSEFFDALDKTEKELRDYQSKTEELNDNFCKSESQRKKFRDKFLYAEQEVAAAKAREQGLQEQLLKEVNDNKERLQKHILSYNELELKLQNEVKLRNSAESSAALAKDKATSLEGKLSQLSAGYDLDKKRLHNELEQLRNDLKLSGSRSSLDLERMECRAYNAEKESKLLKDQNDELRKQVHESLNEKMEVEKKLSSFTFQGVTSTEATMLVKHLQEELRNYESEVREARTLKSSHENIELLKEKLLEEKSHRERAESELLKIPQLQQRLKELEDELASWNLMIKDIPNVSRCEDIPNKFSALQKEVIDSMMKVGEVNAHLKQMEVALDALEMSKHNAEAELLLAREREDTSKLEAKQIKSMLSMVTEERDQLRNVVSELKKQKNVEGGDEVTNATLEQELESSVSKKESCINELDSNLREQRELNNRQRTEIMLLTEKLNSELRRIKSLERDSDRLRSEVALLESKLGHGDFSAANTKVLRMVNTLTVENEAKQTIEALQAELQKAKEKLNAVEELNGQSAGTGEQIDSYISGKIVKLKEQIATLEKREERYKAVFADRISVFRRACCELFGYKILMDDHRRPDGISVTRFTLQSIYALSDEEKLEFEYESGNTRILASEYTSVREISHQVEIFIRKMNSIPAFTANLTVESFNKRTLS